MIKNKFYIIVLFTLILLVWLFYPRPITPLGYFDDLLIKYEERQKDTSIYTSKCNNIEIMMVVEKYGKNGNQEKCKEWIEKRDFCISLHLEYKGAVLQDASEVCVKKI